MQNTDIFSIFFNMKVYYVFPLESPHRGDSNVYTIYTIFSIKEKITLNYSKPASMRFFPRGSRTSSEIAMVNKPSVFEALKFYCIMKVSQP